MSYCGLTPTQQSSPMAKGPAPSRFHKMKPRCRQHPENNTPCLPGAPSLPISVTRGQGNHRPDLGTDRAGAGYKACMQWDHPRCPGGSAGSLVQRTHASSHAIPVLGNDMNTGSILRGLMLDFVARNTNCRQRHPVELNHEGCTKGIHLHHLPDLRSLRLE